jgi:putative transposase
MIDCFFPSSRLCRFCGCINSNLTLADRIWTCGCGAVLDRDRNASLNIEREALNILCGSGFTEQVKNGRGADVRLFGAICDEASKMAEERRPSELVI